MTTNRQTLGLVELCLRNKSGILRGKNSINCVYFRQKFLEKLKNRGNFQKFVLCFDAQQRKVWKKENVFIQAHLSFWMLDEHKRILVVPKVNTVGSPMAEKRVLGQIRSQY